jgi:hypothetical protein
LITVTAGATAVGGGDLTVVVLFEFEFESVVDLLVESVTIGSIAHTLPDSAIADTARIAHNFLGNAPVPVKLFAIFYPLDTTWCSRYFNWYQKQ